MPFDDPDFTDPMTLHGVVVETEDDQAMRTMAECFIEEYARLGFEASRILRLFRTPGYAGPNMALHALGEPVISELIGECLARWGPRRSAEPGAAEEDGVIRLTVLDGSSGQAV
ncbi:MAG: hypothetical protein HY763_06545 [Planctomycetes bacterium]|nr:hypothetical protein [Planctomycetota bacterium]